MCGRKKYAGYDRSSEGAYYGGGRRGGFRRPKHNIPVNIIENDTEFIAYVHAVTFPKESIRLVVAGDMLYISGTRSPADLHPNFILQEYPIKSFERVFELSETVDTSRITARHEDGVLIITAPKTAEAQRPEREIDIV